MEFQEGVPRLAGAGRWSAAARPTDRAPLPPRDPAAPSRGASSPPPARGRGRGRAERSPSRALLRVAGSLLAATCDSTHGEFGV